MAGRRILLVEGSDDLNVVKQLCGNRGIPRPDIRDIGGVDALLESFPVQLKAGEEGDVFGLVIDADVDIAARWDALRNRLCGLGYEAVPATPIPTGTILEFPPGKLLPRVGIWIMPDNRTPGMLEDFLRFLIPQHSILFEHAQSSVVAIPADERRFAPQDDSKALIHTWLAWQKKPGKPFGIAITARYLDADVPQVDTFIAWLKTLFFPETVATP